MKVAYIGNFGPEHSTENHVGQGFLAAGHELIPIQEGAGAWDEAREVQKDLLLWTRTADLDQFTPEDVKLKVIADSEAPVVGFHLDRWWGLQRQQEVSRSRAFFAVDMLISADGGHEDVWEGMGINHFWLPPAVSEFECGGGNWTEEFSSDVAFVGSWEGYHKEWKHRPQLINWLRNNYGEQVKFWPRPGEHAIRNAPLRNLYASVKVLVGDSCLSPGVNKRVMKNYWSDRVPETMGRGGFLLHPATEGLSEAVPMLKTWDLYQWDQLKELIDYYLANEHQRKDLAAAGRDHILEHHTYTVRAKQVVEALTEKGML